MLTTRRATAADATELARLASSLVNDTGEWTSRAAHFFHTHADTDRVAAFVIDRPGGLAACASATITRSIPGPDHTGTYAHIHTVYTEPDHRLRRYARATVQALLGWLAAQGCGLITLNASDGGAPLYRSLGFTINERAMRLIRPPGTCLRARPAVNI
ncbi:GNAT family N-acetyltransferase [Kitasatospora sp. NPDC085879]|uniref:GNAT family N-acetyltransferase n=1 Tax=Kitasatospora sp. NPDC085879 TaxID=3154769 RepID=UPI000BC6A05C|nr:GNAT family N-acetyltransferase [Streptomyces sp. TLI_235]PBC69936.1 ribosomal protein S18 acetylase RimI-like enzyme [Streptomyces sp. TLI_235]